MGVSVGNDFCDDPAGVFDDGKGVGGDVGDIGGAGGDDGCCEFGACGRGVLAKQGAPQLECWLVVRNGGGMVGEKVLAAGWWLVPGGPPNPK